MPTDTSLEKPWLPGQWDLNGDGAFTVADVGPVLGEMYFLPGDWAIWWLAEATPALARFLELDASSYGSLLSGLVSAFIWLFGTFVLLVVVRAIRLFDAALTQRVRGAYDEALRRARRMRTALLARLHRGPVRGSTGAPIEFAEEAELGPGECRVLEALLAVPPPYALSLAEIARAGDVARSQAAAFIARLKTYKFVSAVGSGAYDDPAYAITSAGRAYLVFKQLGGRRA